MRFFLIAFNLISSASVGKVSPGNRVFRFGVGLPFFSSKWRFTVACSSKHYPINLSIILCFNFFSGSAAANACSKACSATSFFISDFLSKVGLCSIYSASSASKSQISPNKRYKSKRFNRS